MKTEKTLLPKLYPFYVWLTSILTGTLVFSLYDLFWGTNNNFGDFLNLLMKLLLFNLFLGLPALLILCVGFYWLNDSRMSITAKKWILILLAFSLFLFTWFMLNSIFGRYVFFSAKSLFIYFDFLVCIIVSSFLFARRGLTDPTF